jgi:exodeoxyribonuclease-3
MRFITANLNGVRSAASKGFFDWLDQQQADAVGVQELKAQADVVESQFRSCDKLAGHFHYAEKKGYSGVGLYTKEEPSDLITGLGIAEFDCEGRWVEKRFDKPGRKLSLISVYFPSGTSGEERQQVKYRFLAEGRARVHPRRRRQHRAQGNRPEELAQQPEEQRLPAGGTRVADAALRRGR